jgi:hypothetical protein
MKWKREIVQPFFGPSIKSQDKLFSKIHIKKNYKREGVKFKDHLGKNTFKGAQVSGHSLKLDFCMFEISQLNIISLDYHYYCWIIFH